MVSKENKYYIGKTIKNLDVKETMEQLGSGYSLTMPPTLIPGISEEISFIAIFLNPYPISSG